jgi:hypothetical protein
LTAVATRIDPYAVLGISPEASPAEARAARRALVKALHPDLRGADQPRLRAAAERRLAEVNAAYDALTAKWGNVAAAAAPPAASATRAAAEASFVVGVFRPDAFEALVVAAADVGDVTDADEPFSLELFVEGPPRGFCRLELLPEAGGTVVTADSEQVDAALVCQLLVGALGRLGLVATDGSAR